MYQAAQRERSQLSPDDVFLPHQYDEATVARIRSMLAVYPEIQHGYVVCKKLEHFADEPMHVIGLVLKGAMREAMKAEYDKPLAELLVESLKLPHDYFVVILNGEWKKVIPTLHAIPGAHVYEKL